MVRLKSKSATAAASKQAQQNIKQGVPCPKDQASSLPSTLQPTVIVVSPDDVIAQIVAKRKRRAEAKKFLEDVSVEKAPSDKLAGEPVPVAGEPVPVDSSTPSQSKPRQPRRSRARTKSSGASKLSKEKDPAVASDALTPCSDDTFGTPSSRKSTAKATKSPACRKRKRAGADAQPKPRKSRKKAAPSLPALSDIMNEDDAFATPSSSRRVGGVVTPVTRSKSCEEDGSSSTPSSTRSKVRYVVQKKGPHSLSSARGRRADSKRTGVPGISRRKPPRTVTATLNYAIEQPPSPGTWDPKLPGPKPPVSVYSAENANMYATYDKNATRPIPMPTATGSVPASASAAGASHPSSGSSVSGTANPSCSEWEEVPPDIDHQRFDQEIQRKASKARISVRNVKHIIKSIISNEQVLAMMQYEEARASDPTGAALPPSLKPRLTRSVTRQMLADSQLTQLPLTPVKRAPTASSTEQLILQEFPEDDDDEEYTPCKAAELSEAPSSPSSPAPSTPCSASVCSSQPQTPATPGSITAEVEEPPSRRTRSRLPLTDQPLEELERLLVAPDVTPDMYVSVEDDEDWASFLQTFNMPVCNNESQDDEEDEEYVFQLHEEEEVEREELRGDPAVRIPQKEVNKLMLELFKDVDELQWAPTGEPDPQLGYVPGRPILLPDPRPAMTAEHARQLDHQMAAHVQLLAQTHLLSSEREWLGGVRADCSALLVELNSLASALHPEDPTRSFFFPANLGPALELVADIDSRTQEELSAEPSKFYKVIAGKRKYCRLSDRIVDTILESTAFVFPELLPQNCAHELDLINDFNWVTQSTDQLIAMGMEMFTNYLRTGTKRFIRDNGPCSLMAKYMMPVSRRKLLHRIHCVRRAHRPNPNNPIMFYMDKHRAPPVPIVNTLPKYPLKPFRKRIKELEEPWKSLAVRGNAFFKTFGKDWGNLVVTSRKMNAMHPPPDPIPPPCEHCKETGYEEQYAETRRRRKSEEGGAARTRAAPTRKPGTRSSARTRARTRAETRADGCGGAEGPAAAGGMPAQGDILAMCMPSITDATPTPSPVRGTIANPIPIPDDPDLVDLDPIQVPDDPSMDDVDPIKVPDDPGLDNLDPIQVPDDPGLDDPDPDDPGLGDPDPDDPDLFSDTVEQPQEDAMWIGDQESSQGAAPEPAGPDRTESIPAAQQTVITDASDGEELVSVVNEAPPPAAAAAAAGSQPRPPDTAAAAAGPMRLVPAEGSEIELKEEGGRLVVYIRGPGRPTLRVPVRASSGSTRLLLPPTLALQETAAGRPAPGAPKRTGVVAPTVRQDLLSPVPSAPEPPASSPPQSLAASPPEPPASSPTENRAASPPEPPAPTESSPTTDWFPPMQTDERPLFKQPFTPHKSRRTPRKSALPAPPPEGVITAVYSVTTSVADAAATSGAGRRSATDSGAVASTSGAAGEGVTDASAGDAVAGTSSADVNDTGAADADAPEAAPAANTAAASGPSLAGWPAPAAESALPELPNMMPPSLMTPLRPSSPPAESSLVFGFPTPCITPAPGADGRRTPPHAMLETPLVHSPPSNALLETPRVRHSPPGSPHTPPLSDVAEPAPTLPAAGSSDSHSTMSLTFFRRTIGDVRATAAAAAAAAAAAGGDGRSAPDLTSEQSLGGVLDALLTRPTDEPPLPTASQQTAAAGRVSRLAAERPTEARAAEPATPRRASSAGTQTLVAPAAAAAAVSRAGAPAGGQTSAPPAVSSAGRSAESPAGAAAGGSRTQGARRRKDAASEAAPQRAGPPEPAPATPAAADAKLVTPASVDTKPVMRPAPDTKPVIRTEATEETAGQAEEDRELASPAALPAGRSSRPKRSRQQREAELTRLALAPEPPGVRDRREQALAQSFFQRVKDCTENVDPAIYEQFRRLLANFAESSDDEAVLYDVVCRLLKGFPDLAAEFLTFVSPDVAVRRGVVTEHVRGMRLHELARGIDAVHSAHPSQMMKVTRTLTQMTSRGEELTAADLQAVVQPLVRGCPLLSAQLTSLIDSETPPAELNPRGAADFQTAALDGEPAFADFEEVTELSVDEPDPYGTESCPCGCHETGDDVRFRQRERHCERCGLRFMGGRVYLQTGKVLRPARVISCSEPTASASRPPGDGSPPPKRTRRRTGPRGERGERGRRPRSSPAPAAASPPPPPPPPPPAAREPEPADPEPQPEAPWNREDDLEILTSCQRSGDGEKTFRGIQRRLPSRSVAQLQARFQQLMDMLRQQLQQEPADLTEEDL